MRHGIVYVPEDRQLQGCILNMSICENITLPLLTALHKRGWIDQVRERRFAEEYAKRLEVKAPHVHVWVNCPFGWEPAEGGVGEVARRTTLPSHPRRARPGVTIIVTLAAVKTMT